ncbi:hypothetical protein F441_10528, partial [Phytophthora nicotianae CJ01A1]
HSQKFCSKLKVYGADGRKEQSAGIRMLLLVQNEVGQIMGRTLTKSENHAETETFLQSLVSKTGNASDGPRICVCDNANANRNLIERVFGDGVEIKQDPFHVNTRFTDKVSDSSTKRWLAGQLSAAIYDVQRNLRPPEDCEHWLAATLKALDPTAISVKQSEWEGCVASNLAQVRRGDLYVAENQYTEAGGEVRVISTSQLEAIHSKLRAKYHRNPKFEDTNFRSVCQAALMCKDLIPESPQVEYMTKLMATELSNATPSEIYGGNAAPPAEHRPWERLFDLIQLQTNSVEADLLAKNAPTEDIRSLLSITYSKRKYLTRENFVGLLGLEPEFDAVREISAQEFSLLKQLRADR